MADTRARNIRILVGLLLSITIILAVLGAAYSRLRTVQSDARLVGFPIPVQTVPATVHSMQQLIGASGTIEPSMPITLTAKVVSRVLKVPADVGSIVQRGTLLVELDPRLYKANMQSAQIKY